MIYENQQPGFFTNQFNRLQQIYNNNDNNIWNTAKHLGHRGSLYGYGAARAGWDALRSGMNVAGSRFGRQWTNYINAMNNIKNFSDARSVNSRIPSSAPRAQMDNTPRPAPQTQPRQTQTQSQTSNRPNNNLTQPSNNSGGNNQQHRPPTNPQEAMAAYRRQSRDTSKNEPYNNPASSNNSSIVRQSANRPARNRTRN